MASKPPIDKKPLPKKTMVGLLGATCCAILVPMIQKDEGTRYVGYLDLIGVPTKCTGDTYDVVVGRKYSPAECNASLERQIIAHAEPVLKANPQLKERPKMLAAAVGFTYNAGPYAWPKSKMSRLARAGDYKGACNAFLAWDKAVVRKPVKGQQCVARRDGRYTCRIRGLTLRRQREVKLCMEGAV